MSDGNTLVIERQFNTNPERLYEAWTNPEILQKWWGPVGVSVPELQLDVRENGEWTTTFYLEEAKATRVVSGKYLTLDPPNRLVFTWGWSEDGKRGHETEVEILLVAVGENTMMTLTQKTFAETEHRDSHSHGWTSSFTKLDNLL